MNVFLFSILILVGIECQNLFRLSTKQTTKLSLDKSIISTLGIFKATLRSNCSLEILIFNQINNTYTQKGFHRPDSITKNCSYLTIQQGKLMSSQNQQFIRVEGDSFNHSTIFTIDDQGIMRLIATYIKLNRVDQQSFQKNITNFYSNNKYIFAASQFNVRFTTNYGQMENQRGWMFRARNGQLDIYLKQDDSIVTNYVYNGFKFNNSQIQDFNSDTFPSAIFEEITYQPRCFQPRIYLNYKPPFLIFADPYWPKLTVMQQGGYKILQINYAKRSQFYAQQEEKDIHHIRYFSQCPPYTFQHKGKCLTKCPQPYYHEMKGRAGFCRLICQQFTPTDQKNKICTCMNNYEAIKYNTQIITGCPRQSQKYPYGCVCTAKNKYFDAKLTFSCVDKCPNGTFANQGVCMECPAKCNSCQRDSFHRRFLQCKLCQDGYQLDDGQCVKKCNTNLANSLIDSQCKKCNDQNCVNCSNDINICTKCALLWTLSNGVCIKSCPSTHQIAIKQFFNSSCLLKIDDQCTIHISTYYKNQSFLKCDQCPDNKIPHLNKCVNQCPQNYTKFTYNGYTYCSCKNGISINDKCLNLTGCPIKMGFDLYSHSCLSCSFGCLTCMGSTCTSCIPGYFLYVSPQAVICRRQSPLFSCIQQYNLWNGICLVTDFVNLQMTKCRKNIQNCKVCVYNQQNTCVTCQEGFYMFNNTCLKQCPLKHVVYKNISCILLEIQNCQIPHLQSIRQSSIINITLIQKNSAYKNYIFNGIQQGNDPVGFIPYFQKITSSRRITDGIKRQNSFFQPNWVCLKCMNGYGLSDDFKKCLPCIAPCKNCYMAKNTSCLENNASKCKGYIQFSTLNCIKSCNLTDSYPQQQNGILYCKNSVQTQINDVNKIDSAIYVQQNGTKIAYFVFQNQIPNTTNITILIQKSNKTINSSAPKVLATVQKVVPLKDNKYFQVLSSINQDIFIANFTSSIFQLKSVQGYYPPNLVYGSTTLNTHPQFMKTWLAIIGQIMSIVILIMHFIYIGNELLYKMDNLIILVQIIYYFSFVKILIGKLLAQFYYGWIYSHLGFFPNFFTIPSKYRQNDAPISYKLATVDANFIRNAGYSLSLLIIYCACLIVITALIYLIYKIFNKKQIWYPRILKQSIAAGIQFFSMNIVYWAIAHLMYRGNCQSCDEVFYNKSYVFALIFLAGFSIYSIIRLMYNRIGGLYMLKRIIIGAILARAYNNYLYIIPLIIVEIVFTFGRFRFQKPSFKKQKLLILLQFAAYITVYLLCFLCSNAGVNTIIISIIIFVFIVGLMSDFGTLYLQTANQWELEDDNRIQSVSSNQVIERAHTNVNLLKKVN